jgi:hypothetical protein
MKSQLITYLTCTLLALGLSVIRAYLLMITELFQTNYELLLLYWNTTDMYGSPMMGRRKLWHQA